MIVFRFTLINAWILHIICSPRDIDVNISKSIYDDHVNVYLTY